MKWLTAIFLVFCVVTGSSANVTIQFGFDNNASDRGIWVDGVQKTIDFSGGYTGSGESDFNNLQDVDTAVNFSVSGLDIGTFSGTIIPVGGAFNMGATGGSIDNASFDATSEYWTFTFNKDASLTDVDYYGPNSGQQAILVNGTAVAGSPFDNDISDASFSVDATDTLTFGYSEASDNGYALDTFTLDVIPEPSTIGLFGLLGAAILLRRKLFMG